MLKAPIRYESKTSLPGFFFQTQSKIDFVVIYFAQRYPKVSSIYTQQQQKHTYPATTT